MNSEAFKGCVTRLEEVNQAVLRLDPSVRAQAFDVLRSYVTSSDGPFESRHKHPGAASKAKGNEHESSDDDAAAFFNRFNHEKPADNAVLLAARHYSIYGVEPFTAEEMRSSAREVGLTIPTRIDTTYAAARRGGKALFQNLGSGRFRPTVHGEVHFKSTYEVKKGTAKRPTEDGSSPEQVA
jgi:hypothetical protein